MIDELTDLDSTEKRIVRALPKPAKASNAKDLQQARWRHLEEAKRQMARLEQLSQSVGKELTDKECLEEGSEVFKDTDKGDVRDAALTSAT